MFPSRTLVSKVHKRISKDKTFLRFHVRLL
nr:MAG TPA: hypothetical protein [Caudoviricetes sp.]